MPRVILVGEGCRRLAGGQREIEVEADTIRRLLLELDRRFPGLGTQVEEGMAIAIDGTIYQDTYGVPLRPDSEIHVIPRIAGG
jgi:sulfur-carrier protein